jgi:hypothetical protein
MGTGLFFSTAQSKCIQALYISMYTKRRFKGFAG